MEEKVAMFMIIFLTETLTKKRAGVAMGKRTGLEMGRRRKRRMRRKKKEGKKMMITMMIWQKMMKSWRQQQPK